MPGMGIALGLLSIVLLGGLISHQLFYRLLELVGLATRQSVQGLPQDFLQRDRVAVYLLMGYMIDGYTLFVPRE